MWVNGEKINIYFIYLFIYLFIYYFIYNWNYTSAYYNTLEHLWGNGFLNPSKFDMQKYTLDNTRNTE
jgi:hypothetical protein